MKILNYFLNYFLLLNIFFIKKKYNKNKIIKLNIKAKKHEIKLK